MASSVRQKCKVAAVLKDEVCDQMVLIDALMAEIVDKKDASRLIKKVNQLYPLHNLEHLKRVKNEGGHLFILICTKGGMVTTKVEDLQKLSDFSDVQVPKDKPITRSQYDRARAHWPTKFHEDKRLELSLRGELFSEEEVSVIEKFMKVAMSECDSSKCKEAVGAVIVDPIGSQVVAQSSSSSSHPLQHAVMCCIDDVAMGQGGGAWNTTNISKSKMEAVVQEESLEEREDEYHVPAKRQKKDNQYLCTGFDVYLTMEPCVIQCTLAAEITAHDTISLNQPLPYSLEAASDGQQNILRTGSKFSWGEQVDSMEIISQSGQEVENAIRRLKELKNIY